MIVKNDRLQCLACDICGEVVELTRKAMSDPETVFLMKEHMTADHETCEPYAAEPLSERAALNRSFQVRLQTELSRAGAESLNCKELRPPKRPPNGRRRTFVTKPGVWGSPSVPRHRS